MLVYIRDIHNNPLMPTQRVGKVRRMLKNKQAKIINYEPFVVKLLYETSDYVQDVNLGVDTGSRHLGMSATTETRELFASKIILRTDIKSLLETRRECRRNRRHHLRYRKARFMNRVSTKKDGWFAPSIRQRNESHLRAIRFVKSILPIKNIYLELGVFDTQKLQDDSIEHEQYQQGLMTGFLNVKAFVRWRDGNVCQHCKGKSGDKKIEVHHIVHRSQGGSDRPNNLVCLCKTCHAEYHTGNLKLKSFKYLNKKEAKTLRDAEVMNLIKDELYDSAVSEFTDCSVHKTYGYITRMNRQKYKVEKSHTSDARVISKNFNAVPLEYCFYGKFFRRHNRQIYKANKIKGGRVVKAQSDINVHGFFFYDRVRYGSKVCFTSGRRTSGSFALKNLDGSSVHSGISYKKIKFVSHERRLIFQKIKQRC